MNQVDLKGALLAYLPQDRRASLALGIELPDYAIGTVLFADISGFTPLTEALVRLLGPRRGAEALTSQLNGVYDLLIAEVDRVEGSVIGFSGDAITCWFDGDDGRRAVACGLAMQAAMQPVAAVALPDGQHVTLAVKVAIAHGPVRRFRVGDPHHQYLDAIAGATLDRMAAAERVARPGEVVVEQAIVNALTDELIISARRMADDETLAVAVVEALRHPPRDRARQVPPPPAVEPAALQPWLLPPVYARLQAGYGDFLTELRPVVALFLRFSGLDYDGDPDVGTTLNAYICWVQGVVAATEGALVDLTIGDKGSYLYAVWGAPLAHENPAALAAQAALRLQDSATQMPAIGPVSIGVSQGMARTGGYGGQTRRSYGVLGDAINVAARLMQAAAPGEILLTAPVWEALGAAARGRPRPPMALKGKAEPMAVYALTGLSQPPGTLAEPLPAHPLVGRQREWAQLVAWLAIVQAGRGQVVAIEGEAGLGKSRLVVELVRYADRQGIVPYIGSCHAQGTQTPYFVWKPIVRALLGVDPMLALDQQIAQAAGGLATLAPLFQAALPLLAPLLDLPMGENTFTAALAPQDRKGVLEALLLDCLAAAARSASAAGQGLLMVLEDIHWLDPLSHDLLLRIARVSPDWPLMIVMAHRPLEEARRARLMALPRLHRLLLDELDPDEVATLLQNQVPALFPSGTTLPAEVVAAIAHRAQGNPFYAEELLRYLRDRGVNPFAPEALAALELPANLEALILSRLDQLSEPQKALLKAASVIGRLFRFAWLHGYYPALGDAQQLRAELDVLDRLDLTPLEQGEGELVYLFKHILTQEVTYESLPFATRARLHAQLGGWLEAVLGGNAPLDLLAYHYERSEVPDKRREYLLRAGVAAQAGFANEAAIGYFQRLLPFLEEPRARIETLLRLGAVLALVGRLEEAEHQTEQALALAQQAGDPAAVARCERALGTLASQRGDHEQALAWLRSAQARWEALGQVGELAEILADVGAAAWRRGTYAEASEALAASLALATRQGDQRIMALATNQRGMVAVEQGDLEVAASHFAESQALFQALGDRRGLATALNSLGIIAYHQGDHAGASAQFQAALSLRRQLGDKAGVASSLNNLGNVALDAGDFPAARQHIEASLALLTEMGDRAGIGWGRNNLAFMLNEQGDEEGARTLFAENLELFREMGDAWGISASLHGLGEIALRRNAFAQGWALYAENIALLHQEEGDPIDIVQSVVMLASAAQGMGHNEEALTLAAAAEALLVMLAREIQPDMRERLDSVIETSRALLAPTHFASVWTTGTALSLEGVVARVGAFSAGPDDG